MLNTTSSSRFLSEPELRELALARHERTLRAPAENARARRGSMPPSEIRGACSLRATVPEAGPQHGMPTAPPTVTITLPPIAVPATVQVSEAAPAIVTKRNAGHVGMTPVELLRVLRAMRADPRFRDAVISYGKSYRGAAPADVIAFLRAAAPTSTTNMQEDDTAVDTDLLAAAGYEICPRERAAGPRGRRGGGETGAA